MGGDFAPQATVEGAVLAARELKLNVVLVGDRTILQKELDEHDCNGLNLTIEHAPEVVLMDDSPLEVVLSKPQSSLHVCYQMLRRGEVDAVISAGNSGAMMTIGITMLGNLPGIDRPAIASMVPTTEGLALLVDAGANTEAKALNLAQFGIMGSAYMRRLRGLAAPKVAILANGEEDSKGTELTRTAAAMLAQSAPHVNYIGYVEGRDINHGKADVVVTDGFTGNVALKTMEGFASFLLGNLREVYNNSMRGRLSYLLVRKNLRAMRERFDPSEYGGAPLLGVAGRAIIAHGSSSPRAIRNALRAAANESLGEALNHDIVELLGKMSATVPSRMGSKGIRAIFGRMRERLHLRTKEGELGRKTDGHVEAVPERPKIEASAPGAVRGRSGELTVTPTAVKSPTGGLNGAAPAAGSDVNASAPARDHEPDKSHDSAAHTKEDKRP